MLEELSDSATEMDSYPYRIVVDEPTDTHDEGDVVFGSVQPIDEHRRDVVSKMEALHGTAMASRERWLSIKPEH